MRTALISCFKQEPLGATSITLNTNFVLSKISRCTIKRLVSKILVTSWNGGIPTAIEKDCVLSFERETTLRNLPDETTFIPTTIQYLPQVAIDSNQIETNILVSADSIIYATFQIMLPAATTDNTDVMATLFVDYEETDLVQ